MFKHRFERNAQEGSLRHPFATVLIMAFLLMAGAGKARAAHEAITVPLILGDYYAWSYTEIFEDKAQAFGFSVAGVDALGWGWMAFSPDYTSLFLVNVAGIAKTVYPAVVLLSSSDAPSRNRAWIALGTHTVTLVTLEALGRPELGVQAMGPRGDGTGVTLAFRF
jgi:hypothetical protein